jgi:hypothetical protein
MEQLDGYYGISSGRRGDARSPKRYRMDVRKGKRKRGTSSRTPGMLYKGGALLMVVVVICVVCWLVVRGVGVARDKVLPENDRFTIRTIEVVPGRIKTESLVREYLSESGIRRGRTNLFGFDIRAFRANYLELNHVVRDIEVTRILPDTLRVVIHERKPLLRMGEREFVACDEEGLMFPVGAGAARLPYVIGGPARPRPGGQVTDPVRPAIEIARMRELRPDDFGLDIYALDVRRDDLVKVYVMTPWRMIEGWVSWYGMKGVSTEESRVDLLERLKLLRATIVKYEGRYGTVDVTLAGKVSLRD